MSKKEFDKESSDEWYKDRGYIVSLYADGTSNVTSAGAYDCIFLEPGSENVRGEAFSFTRSLVGSLEGILEFFSRCGISPIRARSSEPGDKRKYFLNPLKFYLVQDASGKPGEFHLANKRYPVHQFVPMDEGFETPLDLNEFKKVWASSEQLLRQNRASKLSL